GKNSCKGRVGELFAPRSLFAKRHLTASERGTLRRITRGSPQLRRLRETMDEVYRLFDRRCRMATALAKLAALRARLRRSGRLRAGLKKLLSPGLEKALGFLDERLMGAASNAVGRGNRRDPESRKAGGPGRAQRAIP